MRTYGIGRRNVVGDVLLSGLILALAISVLRERPALGIVALLAVAWFAWSVAVWVRRVTVSDDGTVEVRSPLASGTLHATEILSVRRGSVSLRYPVRRISLHTAAGRWMLHPSLAPVVSELVRDLRRHNPDLQVGL